MLHATCYMLHAMCYMQNKSISFILRHPVHATLYMLQATWYMLPGVPKISILKTRLKIAVELKTARFNQNFSFNPMPSMH